MRIKNRSIADADMVVVKITERNRYWLRAFERRLMDESGTKEPTAITNAEIVNRAIQAGYEHLRGRK